LLLKDSSQYNDLPVSLIPAICSLQWKSKSNSTKRATTDVQATSPAGLKGRKPHYKTTNRLCSSGLEIVPSLVSYCMSRDGISFFTPRDSTNLQSSTNVRYTRIGQTIKTPKVIKLRFHDFLSALAPRTYTSHFSVPVHTATCMAPDRSLDLRLDRRQDCKGLRKGCQCLVTGLYSIKKLFYARVQFIYV
jgi:hypothetical protein